MPSLNLNLVESNNYLNERLDKLQEVMKVLQEVLNSTSFEKGIKNFMTDGERTFFFRRNFLGTRYIDHPYTNEQVYDIIMQGVEKPGNASSNSMDLYLTLKNGSDGNVIGFGNPGHKEIFTYSTMFDSMEIPELANHYVHEWCHKLGFVHAFERNRRRKYSVPYGVGDVVEELAETLTGQHDVLLEGSGNEVSAVFAHDDHAAEEQDPAMLSDLKFEAAALRPWRVAESLKKLLQEVNTLAPNRNKKSDGTIGDGIHETRNSDHNAWVTDQTTNKGVVTALDITHSTGTCDCNVIAQSLQAAKDPRIKYVIWNRRIMNASSIDGSEPWAWRTYKGPNPHDHHIHISVKPEKSLYDSTANWNIRVS